MKRRIVSLFLAVLLCAALTVPAFAAGSSESAPSGFNPIVLIVCLVIGFLLALIPMGILKGQIRNVKSKTEATDYTREGSFDLQIKQDRFLYKRLDKTPIPKNDSK